MWFKKIIWSKKRDEQDIGINCPQCRHRTLVWNESHSVFECLNSRCRRVYEENEVNLLHRTFMRNVIMLAALVTAGAGVIVYVLFHSFEIDLIVASVIIAAGAIITFRNASTLRTLWNYRLQHVQFIMVIVSVIVIGLTWCAAAAYTGIAPFSGARDAITEIFDNQPQILNTIIYPTASPTPTPALLESSVQTPTPTPAPSSTPILTPTPTTAPTATPDPVKTAYNDLAARYIAAGDWTIPISLENFKSLAQSWGIEGAVNYVASGRWDSRYPLDE